LEALEHLLDILWALLEAQLADEQQQLKLLEVQKESRYEIYLFTKVNHCDLV